MIEHLSVEDFSCWNFGGRGGGFGNLPVVWLVASKISRAALRPLSPFYLFWEIQVKYPKIT